MKDHISGKIELLNKDISLLVYQVERAIKDPSRYDFQVYFNSLTLAMGRKIACEAQIAEHERIMASDPPLKSE